MRLNETITFLGDTLSDMGITAGGAIIDGYSAVEEGGDVISSVTVIFPVGRAYCASAQTQLAANFPVYNFVGYDEVYGTVTNPVALQGIRFEFTWVDSGGS